MEKDIQNSQNGFIFIYGPLPVNRWNIKKENSNDKINNENSLSN